jgi:hypothetical protein
VKRETFFFQVCLFIRKPCTPPPPKKKKKKKEKRKKTEVINNLKEFLNSQTFLKRDPSLPTVHHWTNWVQKRSKETKIKK